VKYTFQHAKLRVSEEMLKYCNLETFTHIQNAFILSHYVAAACGKISISSSNHSMYLLTINGNRHVRAQHRLIMASSQPN